MPWVRFLERFDWKMHPRQMRRFEAGTECMVTSQCAALAVGQGKAETMPVPHRDSPEAQRMREWHARQRRPKSRR